MAGVVVTFSCNARRCQLKNQVLSQRFVEVQFNAIRLCRDFWRGTNGENNGN